MKLAVEKLTDILASGRDWKRSRQLLIDHWDEVVADKELMDLSVGWLKYKEAEQADRLHVVVMRDDDGEIVGYSVHFLTKHPHYQDLLCAEDDVHYLVPALRGSGNHERMRAFALGTLKKRDVQFVTARVKVGHEHDNVLRALGYRPIDMVYGLNLSNWTRLPED